MTSEIIIATTMRPFGETGVQTHFNAYSEYLTKHKIPHQIVTPFSYYLFFVYPVFAVRKILQTLSGELNVWWYRYWHAFFLRLALKKRLKSGRDCIVYAQCPLSADAALKARVSVNQRVVLVIHFNVSQADEWREKGVIAHDGWSFSAIRNFEANLLPQLDGLVFVSRFMHSQLLSRIPAIAEIPAVVAPNFLADPGPPATCAAKADLINIGTLETRKNQQYLLEIIAKLRNLGMPVTLTIVGDGPDRAMLEEKARSLNISDLVHFAGFVRNASESIPAHQAYIHVATIESFGITLIEAMARQRPVFAIPVGGIPEIFSEGGFAVSLPVNDASAAADLIAHALKNREWMINAGQTARECFVKTYTSEVCAKKLTGFLESITDKV